MENERNNRKKRNQEIERAKKQRMLVVRSVFIGIAAVIVAALGVWAWYSIDVRTVMHVEFEGVRTRVAESDFHFVTLMGELEGAEPTAEAHEHAIEALVQTLVILQHGESLGLAVSEEDMQMLAGEAAMLREQLQWHPTRLNFITDRRIAEIWSAAPMYELLMEWYKPEETFELSPEQIAETEELVAEHLENAQDWFVEREIKYAATNDWEGMEAAVTAHMDGEMDFNEVIREISISYDGEIQTVEFWEFFEEYELWGVETWADLLEYGEGETSHVFAQEDMLYIMHVVSITLDEEALEEEEENFRENRFRLLRSEAFNEIVEEWTASARIERNERSMRRALRRSENSVIMHGF